MRIQALAATVAAISLLASTTPTIAGSDNTLAWKPSCSAYEGITYCGGNMASTRGATTGIAWAEFTYINNVYYFAIRIANTWYSCSAGSEWRDGFQAAMASNAYFTVGIDANGKCVYLMVQTGSDLKNFSAL